MSILIKFAACRASEGARLAGKTPRKRQQVGKTRTVSKISP
nr:MAG TPA: hypothetical protein [Caudoviricetes sp.]